MTSEVPGQRFKSPYVWPNPAFPFRIYLDHPKCRLFIIENLSHNWDWMSKYHNRIRDTDFFIVIVGSFFDLYTAKKGREMIDVLGLRQDNFFILCNDEREVELFETVGFQCDLINQNAWLDETGPMQIRPTPKLYDAVYVARLIPLKRHELARGIENLALVAGANSWSQNLPPPPHRYLNDVPLSRAEVCDVINKSRAGLILSAKEGACFASSEYLLCGIPVVSTKSMGGRHVWYNEYNSLIVDDTPDAVRMGVEYFLANPRSPERIRHMHIQQAEFYREKFIALLGDIFKKFGLADIDPAKFFRDNFVEKLRKSYLPDFEVIFPASGANG